MTGWILSAYAASPTLAGFGLDAEAEYLDRVTQLPGIAGLELPFSGRLHPIDEEWFLRRAPRQCRYTVTTIPDTMAQIEADPTYGLASTHAGGRARAVRRAAEAAAAVRRLNHALGWRAVDSVALFSAPRIRTGWSSGAALAASLVAVASLDWDGARLVVEHADTPVRRRPLVKGFLPIGTEIDAVRVANRRLESPIGLVVNWGRSMIETRRSGGPIAHVRRARRAGLLDGVVISGCAAVDTPFGAGWDDAHLPPQPVAADSMLRPRHVARILRAAGHEPRLLGLKVAAPAGADIATRIAVIEQSVACLSAAVTHLPAIEEEIQE